MVFLCLRCPFLGRLDRPMTSHDSAEKALERIVSWGVGRSDIRAVAVVGSYATGRPRQDSDIDVILLTTRPSDYITGDTWMAELDAGDLIQTRHWGAITERRLSGVAGIQIDIGIGEPTWASASPVDPGTRQVVAHGLRVLYDPDRLLERLMKACRRLEDRQGEHMPKDPRHPVP